MGTPVADRVDEWNERSFGGGYRGLTELAEADFSGVVRADGAELYMTRGVCVGILDGDIETFDGPATVLEAPSPALPLLAVMQEKSEEVRDRFYTEKTPLSEVDQALSQGGFTGYIELSENVLSGDYYVVYHAGKSMSVAFVGQSSRLLDGETAFETANDEVGIYEVRPVAIEPVEIPRPEPTGQQETEETAKEDSSDADTISEDSDTISEEDDDALVEDSSVDERADDASVDERAEPTEKAATEEPTTIASKAATVTPAREPKVHSVPSLDPDRTVSDETTGVDEDPAETADTDRIEYDDQSQDLVKSLETERDQLREQLDRLQAERDAVSAQPETNAVAREVTPQEALESTAVFVRYRSQSAGTLKDAHRGALDRESLRENLQLEIYSRFEEAVTVDGQRHEQFIIDSLAYRFLDWLAGELIFEIRETGNQKVLSDLYDVLSRIDRADFNGTIVLEDDEFEFDLVLRDRRERPLVVANIDNQRGPVSGVRTKNLVTAAKKVSAEQHSLAGAFLVTREFFDAGALEAVDDATKGGLLSRAKRKSFVNASRKAGYHLCLVEARENIPHLVVPEL